MKVYRIIVFFLIEFSRICRICRMLFLVILKMKITKGSNLKFYRLSRFNKKKANIMNNNSVCLQYLKPPIQCAVLKLNTSVRFFCLQEVKGICSSPGTKIDLINLIIEAWTLVTVHVEFVMEDRTYTRETQTLTNWYVLVVPFLRLYGAIPACRELSDTYSVNSVADPRFPRWEGSIAKGGGANVTLLSFPKKLHQNEKMVAASGRCSSIQSEITWRYYGLRVSHWSVKKFSWYRI